MLVRKIFDKKIDSKFQLLKPYLFLDEMMVLVPSDAAMKRLVPELKEEVSDPLENDLILQQNILSNHIIIHEGSIPPQLWERLPEYMEVIKINMRGENVVFHRENGADGKSKDFKGNFILSQETLTLNSHFF